MMLIVPGAGAPIGSSPDFVSGPVLQHSLFPIHLDWALYRNRYIVDPAGDSDYPALSAVLPPDQAGDGWSHVVLAWGENTEYIPATPGCYYHFLVATDAGKRLDGNGPVPRAMTRRVAFEWA